MAKKKSSHTSRTHHGSTHSVKAMKKVPAIVSSNVSENVPVAPMHHAHPSIAAKGPKHHRTVFFVAIALIAIIATILAIMYIPSKEVIVARVGTVEITMDELNASYQQDIYRGSRNLYVYLNEVVIPEQLLLLAAADISDSTVESLYKKYIADSNMTEEQAQQILQTQGITIDRFKRIIKIQEFINRTIAPTVVITDAEVSAFYDENKEMLAEEGSEVPTLAEIGSDIKNFLYQQKIADDARAYIDELRLTTTINVYLNENGELLSSRTKASATSGTIVKGSIETFKATGDPICTENGKPIIRLYSTTWCPHCKWVKPTYDDLVKQYVAEGKIVAYHWEIDTKDDTLTDVVEDRVPIVEMDAYQKYNPGGSIPTYVFGCMYSRIGNGHEADQDLDAERTEFVAVIEDLIARAAQ